MLGLKGRQEQLNCKIQDFKDRGAYYEYTESSSKTRTGETEKVKSRRKYSKKFFKGNGDERDSYLKLQTYLSHRPENTDTFYLQSIGNPKTSTWYKTLALKRNGLGNIMKRMIQNKRNFITSSG